MKVRISAIIILFFVATSASAGVIDIIGAEIVVAPSSLQPHLAENETTRPVIFEERKNVTLPYDLEGIPAGTVVNSYMLYWDTPGTQHYSAQGTVYFDEPVLVVLGKLKEGIPESETGALMNSTNALFGSPTTYYPDNINALDRCTSCLDDVLTIDATTNSVHFNWIVGPSVDAVRILTLATPPVVQVSIDIKPGSDPNCFNNNGNGVIPVAILGSNNFDAAQVDAGTVQLEGMSVRAVGHGDRLQAHLEDVNGDGYTDLVVQIADEDGVFQAGDSTAVLTGSLYDGTSIEGSDSICVTQ